MLTGVLGIFKYYQKKIISVDSNLQLASSINSSPKILTYDDAFKFCSTKGLELCNAESFVIPMDRCTEKLR